MRSRAESSCPAYFINENEIFFINLPKSTYAMSYFIGDKSVNSVSFAILKSFTKRFAKCIQIFLTGFYFFCSESTLITTSVTGAALTDRGEECVAVHWGKPVTRWTGSSTRWCLGVSPTLATDTTIGRGSTAASTGTVSSVPPSLTLSPWANR